jgi:hypothetical protein
MIEDQVAESVEGIGSGHVVGRPADLHRGDPRVVADDESGIGQRERQPGLQVQIAKQRRRQDDVDVPLDPDRERGPRLEFLKAPGETGADGRPHAGIEQSRSGDGRARIVRSRQEPCERSVFAHGQAIDGMKHIAREGGRGVHVRLSAMHRP